MQKKIIKFIKSEMMLSVAVAMAVISLFITKPTTKILYDIDWKTLAVLFMLLLVLDGFKNQNLFEPIVNMTSKIKTKTGLCLFFVYGVFISSMFVTNDVSLIIYVPLTMIVFKKIDAQEYILPLLVLESIAAIRGSMLTPFGSPQNLFLFENSQISAPEFIEMMALPCLFSAILLFAFVIILNKINLKKVFGSDENIVDNAKLDANETYIQSDSDNNVYIDANKTKLTYVALFILVVFTIVSRIEQWYIILGIVIIILLVIDREVFKRVDYALIFTFLCFFIFSSQIAANTSISNWLCTYVEGHEYAVSIILSQFISNVPTSIVLWPFSANLRALIYGLDSAGLLSIIGSLATLINLRLYIKEYPRNGLKFIKVFETISIVFFVIICAFQLLILH